MSYANDWDGDALGDVALDALALEQAIDEKYADFTGTGLRPTHKPPCCAQKQRTHTKENTMARSKQAIQHEINETTKTMKSLGDHRARLYDELRNLAPAEPNQPRASVRVKFNPEGKEYEFLLMRAPQGQWYTTGVRSEHNVFVSWNRLVGWLNSSDVYWYSEIMPLVPQSETQAPF